MAHGTGRDAGNRESSRNNLAILGPRRTDRTVAAGMRNALRRRDDHPRDWRRRYIGSHMVKCLRDAGRDVLVIDDLSADGRGAAPDDDVRLLQASVADTHVVARVPREHDVRAIVHFAAKIRVGESVTDPCAHRDGHVVASALLGAALDANVPTFLLSSTAAVDGTPARAPISQDAPQAPNEPHGVRAIADQDGPRRDGDPPALVASPERATQRTSRSELRRIVADAWAERVRARAWKEEESTHVQ